MSVRFGSLPYSCTATRRPSSGCVDIARMTPSVVGSVASMPGLSPSTRSARAGLGPRVMVRSLPSPCDEARPQRGLVLVDAAQDARQAFAGDQHEIIEATLGEIHGKREHLRAVRGIVDGDQRAAQDPRAAPFEQCAEDFQLAHLGYRNCLSLQVPVDHRGWTISPRPSAGSAQTPGVFLHRFAQGGAPLRRVSVQETANRAAAAENHPKKRWHADCFTSPARVFRAWERKLVVSM